jgi:glutathione synthase/RimK-type ligase-like ATP-grasp enzyme
MSAPVLLTTSCCPRHLPNFYQNYRTVFLDQPLTFDVSKDAVVVFADKGEIEITRSTRVVFLPFSSFLENNKEHGSDNALSLIFGLRNIGVPVRNNPISWLASYDKSIMFRLSDAQSVPPETHISFRPDRYRHLWQGSKFIIKNGFGVRRDVDGLLLHAAVLSDGISVGDVRGQRVVLQPYIPAQQEIRAYVTRIDGSCRSMLFQMPVGSESEPDWRDTTTDFGENSVLQIGNTPLHELSDVVLSELELEYLCIDFLISQEKAYVIDVNPHGSWHWLPPHFASSVEKMVSEFIEG